MAIKNDSLRILSASKLAGINKKNSFFNEKSPFLVKSFIKKGKKYQGKQFMFWKLNRSGGNSPLKISFSCEILRQK